MTAPSTAWARIGRGTLGGMGKARLLCVGVGAFLALIVAVTATTYGLLPAGMVMASGCRAAQAAGQHLGRLQANLPERNRPVATSQVRVLSFPRREREVPRRPEGGAGRGKRR